MKRIKTLTLAVTILTLTLGAFPRHASAAVDNFLHFPYAAKSSSTQLSLSTVAVVLASVLLP